MKIKVMKIPKLLQVTGTRLFGAQLEFRVRLFNIMASAGVFIGLFFTVFDIINKTGTINTASSVASMLVAAALLYYSCRTGRYQLCYMATIITIFLGIFPLFFFIAGAYQGSMNVFFIFAVIFTVCMLEGKKALIMAAIEIAVYISLYLIAFNYPHTVKWYTTETEMLTDIIASFVLVSFTLGTTIFLHLRLHNRQNKKFEAASKKAEEYAKMRDELFAGISHEMRTPLTVMSAYAQYAVEQIRTEGANEQTLTNLVTISDEAKRLAEMANDTINVLLMTTETGETYRQRAMSVDMGNLSRRLIKLFEPIASRNGRKLMADIKEDNLSINGHAGALTQLLWNMLHNAMTYSECKIEFMAEANVDGVKIMVRNDGDGIAPDILPHIFKRGIYGKNGRNGIGLSICRDIAMSHGGEISAESTKGNGACITVALKGITEQMAYV